MRLGPKLGQLASARMAAKTWGLKPPEEYKEPAERVIKFFEQRLTHSIGEWKGEQFKLAKWQRDDIVRPLFNTLVPGTNLRQYRTCYVEVPRKNGKSTLAAGLALYLLFSDSEPGAQIVCAAADRDQASIVFSIAKSMIEGDDVLTAGSVIYRREIVVPATDSILKVISSEAYSKHGMNLHGAIIDEVHAHPNRELYDVLNTATASRRQPLVFAITTAGFDRVETNLCWTLHMIAERVKAKPDLDPTFLPVLYGALPTDDWTDETVWRKANPCFQQDEGATEVEGTVKLEYLRKQCRSAQETPIEQNVFRRLHLNVWTESETAWMSMGKWDACYADYTAEDLVGESCFAGLDISNNTDLSALALLFPRDDGTFRSLVYAWCPAEGIRKRSTKDRAPYDLWRDQGFLEATPGDGVDQDVVKAKLLELRLRYHIQEIAFDPWNLLKFAQEMEREGATMVELGQTMRWLSAPTKLLENLVINKRLQHNGHPVLRWCVSNTMVDLDHAGNVRPSKEKSTEKIDCVVALVMALQRASVAVASPYESRGVLVL